MKKFLTLGLLLIPFLFQNCTVELAEIDEVVSPDIEFEYQVASSDDQEESLSARSKSQNPEDLTEASVNPI